MSAPWARAVADAAEEPDPASAETAVRGELVNLWSDLDIAIDMTIRTSRTPPGAWSMGALSIAGRIIVLSRLVGATPWEQISQHRLLDGTYHGLLTDAGIEHTVPGEDDLRQMREWIDGQYAAARGDRTASSG